MSQRVLLAYHAPACCFTSFIVYVSPTLNDMAEIPLPDELRCALVNPLSTHSLSSQYIAIPRIHNMVGNKTTPFQD